MELIKVYDKKFDGKQFPQFFKIITDKIRGGAVDFYFTIPRNDYSNAAIVHYYCWENGGVNTDIYHIKVYASRIWHSDDYNAEELEKKIRRRLEDAIRKQSSLALKLAIKTGLF